MPAPTLTVQLECELPSTVSIGRGTALFVGGWCFSPEARIRTLAFEVAGTRQPVAAHSMPRLDPFQALHPSLDLAEASALTSDPESRDDPLLHSYRSGFWGIVRLAPTPAGTDLVLGLRAELESGTEVAVELARIAVRDPGPHKTVRWPGASGPRVAICMASYNPPLDLFRRQIESIRRQDHGNWVCLISDDCSAPESMADIEATIAGDPRFVLSRSPSRLGFYRNFERALSLTPPDAEFVAMADQDDVWDADKLTALLAGIGRAQLVYSDARVVSRDGELLSETWWNRRRNNHSDLLSLLVANSVTGAASLLRRELLDDALPFPPAQFAHFHDHWVALVALALGDIAFVDRPLYDYTQHSAASLGHTAANQMPSLRDRLLRQRDPRERVRMWRLHYFVDGWRLLQLATVLELRCGERMSRRKRLVLTRWLDVERSPVELARLAVRGLREFVGTPETLGAEWMLFHAFAWRRLLAATARDRPQRGLRLDALPPASLIQQPGKVGLDERAAVIADKVAPLFWAPSRSAPRRVNLLIPTFDLRHFFGGYIGKLNLAKRLADRGVRVRIVTTDPVGPLPPNWRQRVESYSGLEGLLDRVEVAFGRESGAIEISGEDGFIATTWWTAHIAADALRHVAAERFVYLIQEYEPFTFPMGTYAALARESYECPHFGLFSTELLRDYFRLHRIGVFAAGAEAGDRASVAFENAITAVPPPTVETLARRERRRLLVYARPEPHAARNMFELGLLGLVRAIGDGAFQSGWELHGIGTVERGRRIALGGGAALELLPRTDQRAYADLLREHDVGLALMYTPHPSLVPIEMASAGMLTVTNTFGNKTAEELTAISPNLIAAEPTVTGIATALHHAAAAASDLEARVRGSAVRWSTDWGRSFDDERLDLVMGALASADAALV